MVDPPEQFFQHIGLMLDYDGTLTPIVSNPQDAKITTSKVNILKRLAQSPRIYLAIVSGRSVQQLEGFLKGLIDFPVVFCGLHGGEIIQYPEKHPLKVPLPGILDEVATFKVQLLELLTAQGITDSVFLEDKGYSLAMHYRQADEKNKEQAVQCFCTVFNSLEADLERFRPQGGKEVLELVPKDFSKGSCVEFLMDYWKNKIPAHTFYPMYVGDDLTDESAFQASNLLGGTSLRVGERNANTSALCTITSVNLLYYELTQMLLQPSTRLSQL